MPQNVKIVSFNTGFSVTFIRQIYNKHLLPRLQFLFPNAYTFFFAAFIWWINQHGFEFHCSIKKCINTVDEASVFFLNGNTIQFVCWVLEMVWSNIFRMISPNRCRYCAQIKQLALMNDETLIGKLEMLEFSWNGIFQEQNNSRQQNMHQWTANIHWLGLENRLEWKLRIVFVLKTIDIWIDLARFVKFSVLLPRKICPAIKLLVMTMISDSK